jgi:hypothetical protein
VSQILSSLKFVQVKRTAMNVNATEFRRQKLARKIDEQINLASELTSSGKVVVTRVKRVTDETGATSIVEVQRRARAWWFKSDKGTLCVSIRYGAKVIEIQKGRNAIEVASVGELTTTLEIIKTAVLSGELDSQITLAAETVRARFKIQKIKSM